MSIFAWNARRDRNNLHIAMGLISDTCGFSCMMAFGNLQMMFCEPGAGIYASFGICVGVIAVGFLMRQGSQMFRRLPNFKPIAKLCERFVNTFVEMLYQTFSCLQGTCVLCMLCPCVCYDRLSRDRYDRLSQDQTGSGTLQAPTDLTSEQMREDDDYGSEWVESTQEGEDDCLLITIAFLLSQALLFKVLGALPMGGKQHEWPDIVKAACVGAGCIVWIVVGSMTYEPFFVRGEYTKGHEKVLEASTAAAACTCSFIGINIVDWLGSKAFHQPAKMQVLVAIFVMACCVLFMLLVYMVMDRLILRNQLRRRVDDHRVMSWMHSTFIRHRQNFELRLVGCCELFVSSSVLLTGFCWEKAFQVSQREIIITTPWVCTHQVFAKTVFSVCTVCLVTPAWLKYIMPMALGSASVCTATETSRTSGEASKLLQAPTYSQLPTGLDSQIQTSQDGSDLFTSAGL